MSEDPAKPGDRWWRFKFTWTGLIVLLAILGIVAAVAIPSYGDFIHRAQASEAFVLMDGAKTALTQHFAVHKKWPSKLEQVTADTSGKYTLSVAITNGAGGASEIELTATMRTEGVDRRVRGQTVRMLSADGGKNWTCKPGTMEPKNLPINCRD
jgi:type IV pilus assembly protein PilA